MAHEIELKNGVWSFAFSPVEGPGWHNLGVAIPDDASAAEWRKAAGHGFTVSKRQVHFYRAGTVVTGATYRDELLDCPGRFVMARDDNDHALGIASDVYKIVQPAEVDDICDQFAALADGQLARSSAFTLRQGDMICSTYAYRGDGLDIGGDKHKAFLMASTTFDGSGATHFWVSLVRAVCQNTIRAGLAMSRGAKVSIRHNAKLNPDTVRENLAALAQSVSEFKALGDALAKHSMTAAEISALFKAVLEIPLEAKQENISTRKMNQFRDLSRAFARSKGERNGSMDAFTTLQAVTRYVDHDRSVKVNGTGNETIARFDSANFGSGDDLKAKAFNLLMPLISAKVAA